MNEMVTSGVMEVLADPRLLTPEQFAELTERMYPLCPDWHILGREIVYRGWLTAYQMQQILEGNGRSLILDSYLLLEPLAEGGMGRVYKARNWKLDTVVAIKVIRSELAYHDSIIRRFAREILAHGHISHPNIVRAFDAGAEGSLLFYTMEYVPGVDLGKLIQENGPLDIPSACYYVAQTAQALQHAHECGVVHRDIKPSNLLLATETKTIKVLDLGLARFDAAEDSRSQLTRVDTLVGTPDFVSPEQVQNAHDVDIRSDLYSLGCTFYFLLTGQAPFEKEETVDKLYCHVREEAAPVDQLRPDVPAGLAAIIHKLLAKRPQDRFREPADFVEALLPFVENDGSYPTMSSIGSTDRELRGLDVQPLPPTQIVAAAELGLVPAALREEPTAPADSESAELAWPDWKQRALAVAIGLLALLILWKLGIGPGGGPP